MKPRDRANKIRDTIQQQRGSEDNKVSSCCRFVVDSLRLLRRCRVSWSWYWSIYLRYY